MSQTSVVKPFGKRNAAPPPAASLPPTPPAGGSRRFAFRDHERFVPTRLLPFIVVAIVLAVVELGLGMLTGLIPIAASHSDVGTTTNPLAGADRQLAVFLSAQMILFLFILFATSMKLAMWLVLPAHVCLRLAQLTGLAAYAAGSFCVASAMLLWWAAQGERMDLAGCIVELAGGASAGLVYRLFAGTRAVKSHG